MTKSLTFKIVNITILIFFAIFAMSKAAFYFAHFACHHYQSRNLWIEQHLTNDHAFIPSKTAAQTANAAVKNLKGTISSQPIVGGRTHRSSSLLQSFTTASHSMVMTSKTISQTYLKTNAPAAVRIPFLNPSILHQQIPLYPQEAQEQGIEGTVVLKVLVENRGSPSKILMDKSSNHELLDNSALTAVSEWQFSPAKRGGDIVSSWMVVPINFSIQ